MTAEPTDVAHDELFGGNLALAQPARGTKRYRVNVDALLLAAFAARITPGSPARAAARQAVDLGSGVGAVGLCLLFFDAARSVTFVDVDDAMVALAEENVAANGWQDRAHVVVGDATVVANERRGAADLVVCNPPYVVPGRGRAPLAPRARARSGDRATFVTASRTLLGRRGRACFVYPVVEAVSFLADLRAAGLEPKRLVHVHATSTSPARVVLVEAMPGKPGGLVVEPPIVERDAAPTFASRLVRGEISPSIATGRARSHRPTAR